MSQGLNGRGHEREHLCLSSFLSYLLSFFVPTCLLFLPVFLAYFFICFLFHLLCLLLFSVFVLLFLPGQETRAVIRFIFISSTFPSPSLLFSSAPLFSLPSFLLPNPAHYLLFYSFLFSLVPLILQPHSSSSLSPQPYVLFLLLFFLSPQSSIPFLLLYKSFTSFLLSSPSSSFFSSQSITIPPFYQVLLLLLVLFASFRSSAQLILLPKLSSLHHYFPLLCVPFYNSPLSIHHFGTCFLFASLPLCNPIYILFVFLLPSLDSRPLYITIRYFTHFLQCHFSAPCYRLSGAHFCISSASL